MEGARKKKEKKKILMENEDDLKSYFSLVDKELLVHCWRVP